MKLSTRINLTLFIFLPALSLLALFGQLSSDTTTVVLFGITKLRLSYFAVAITVSGYLIYIFQMFPDLGMKAKKPHPLSWVLFGFLTGAGYIVQVFQGAKEGSWCLGVTAIFCFAIAIISFIRFRKEWRYKSSDLLITIGAVILFVVSWIVSADLALATVAAILATSADLVSYAPTFLKAWYVPDEESVINFIFNSVKCIPALFALETLNWATSVYLWMLLIVNGFFALFLVYWTSMKPYWSPEMVQATVQYKVMHNHESDLLG